MDFFLPVILLFLSKNNIRSEHSFAKSLIQRCKGVISNGVAYASVNKDQVGYKQGGGGSMTTKGDRK